MSLPHISRFSRAPRAFTIIELLTVIAIIGILIAVLLPTVTGSQLAAKKAKTKVQFSQWATAIEGFRQEYGYYPTFVGDRVNGTAITSPPPGSLLPEIAFFQEVLSGRGAGVGTPPAFLNTNASAQNKKRIAFLSFGQGDLIGPMVVDAFGNIEIVVLVDKDQNGSIAVGLGGDYTSLPPEVNGMRPTFPTPPDGIRAGVIFYSPGPRRSDADMVKSWE